MLKIKSNVDLKELEKFGFEEHNYSFDNSSWFWINKDVIVDSKTKILDMPSSYNLDYPPEYALDIIYDLGKADLVEKVGDE